jgi:hypothetical protein
MVEAIYLVLHLRNTSRQTSFMLTVLGQMGFCYDSLPHAIYAMARQCELGCALLLMNIVCQGNLLSIVCVLK